MVSNARLCSKDITTESSSHSIGLIPREGESVSWASKEVTTIVSRENLEMRKKALFMVSSEKCFYLGIPSWHFLGNLHELSNSGF